MAMLRQTSQICSRLLSHSEACSRQVVEGLRPLSGSAPACRITLDPLPTTRPAGSPEGNEKPDLVDKYLSDELLPRREVTRLWLQEVARDFERFPGDVGSSEVQVARLTERIKALAEHMRVHRKDYSSRRGLEAMLTQRRQLLQYLRRTKFDTYTALISRLGLKDNYAEQNRYSSRYKPRASLLEQ